MKYHLSDGFRVFGPLEKEEIISYFYENKLLPSDLIWNEKSKEWVVFFHHPDFAHYSNEDLVDLNEKTVTNILPPITELKASPQPQIEEESFTPIEWFIHHDKEIEGPYSYLNMLRMLQDGKIKDHSLVSNTQTSGAHKKLCDYKDFSHIEIGKFQATENIQGLKATHFRRHSERIPWGHPLIIATDSASFKVTGIDISKGGAAIVMKVGKFKENDLVWVKFSDKVENKNYDVKAKILSVRKVKVGNKSVEYTRLGMMFLEVSKVGKLFLEHLK